MAYKNVGTTAHYSISYDTSLTQANGEDRANALLAKCEQDFDLMANWFAGVTLSVGIPIEVKIDNGNTGGGWGPPVSIEAGDGDLNYVRYLLIAEVTEMFMKSQNKGWFWFPSNEPSNEGSNGEGLSIFLSNQFLIMNGLDSNDDAAGWWLDNDRPDFVNISNQHGYTPIDSGCSVLFLYYLNIQLGFDINSIIAAANSTLAGVYKNLTRDSFDPFPDFKEVMDNAFPISNPDGSVRKSKISGQNKDNPFPLPSIRRLSTKNYVSTIFHIHPTSLRFLIKTSRQRSLRSALNINRRSAIL